MGKDIVVHVPPFPSADKVRVATPLPGEPGYEDFMESQTELRRSIISAHVMGATASGLTRFEEAIARIKADMKAEFDYYTVAEGDSLDGKHTSTKRSEECKE